MRLACDIAYLPKSLARGIVFDEEHIFQQMVRLKLDILKDGRGSDIRNSTEGSLRVGAGDRNSNAPAKLMESGD